MREPLAKTQFTNALAREHPAQIGMPAVSYFSA